MTDLRLSSWPLVNLMGLFAVLSISPLHADWWNFGKNDKSTQNLKIDPSPVSATGLGGITSFAPIVKKTAPSVVTISTTKKIHPSSMHNSPMFNDPFLRHFFGDPDGGDGNDSQNPRHPQSRMPDQTQTGLGSGVIVTSDGFILTNNHVIEVADEIKVTVSSTRREYTAKLVGSDPMTDVALIKIEATDLVPMVIADSDKTEVGDIVLAIGSPFGLAQTVTMGIISAKGRNSNRIEGANAYEDFIQTDAAINPGNSGGALVDIQGRMIGLNTAILGASGGNVGIGFAVPSSLASYVMASLLKDGHVTRGYLGVTIQEMTPEFAEEFKLPEITGALVSQVNPGTAAQEAGFKEGDIILEFNGRTVLNDGSLRLMVSETPPNTKCTAKVWRDGKEKMLDVTLKELTPDLLSAAKKENDDSEQSQPQPPPNKVLIEGVKIDDLTADLRRQGNIPPEVRGVVVVDIDPDSIANRPGTPGLEVGDIITEVAKRPVTTVREALDAMKDAKGFVRLRIWNRGNSKEGTFRYLMEPVGK